MKNGERSLSRWEVLQRESFADCRVFSVMRHRCRHPGRGREADFYVLHAPAWVNVIALTEDRRMVLVRQYRFGTEDFSLEIPGGMVDPGEDPVEAAVRELREETGYAGRGAREIGGVHPNPAIQDNRCHLVFIEDARRVHGTDWDGHEELETVVLGVDEAFALARNGGITHSLVIDAFFFFAPYWERLKGGGDGGREPR